MDYLNMSIEELEKCIKNNEEHINILKAQIKEREEANRQTQIFMEQKKALIPTMTTIVRITKDKGWDDTSLHIALLNIGGNGEIINILKEYRFPWNFRGEMNDILIRLIKEYQIERIVSADYKLSKKIEEVITVEYI